MDASFWLLICSMLSGLFILLGTWQRRIDNRQSKKIIEEIRESRERGTHKAIAQYPTVQPSLCIGCGSCVAACPEDGVLGLVDGVAHVIHASRCIGHGRCAEACPVGAITVGLGDISTRPDIPILSDNLETTIPGVYIAGELGGISLVRHAIDQGTRALENIYARIQGQTRNLDPKLIDVLIIGAGPAGLAASLKAIERKLRYLSINQDDIGGTIRKYPRRKLTLIQEVHIPLHGAIKSGEYQKEDLIALWENIIEKYQVNIRWPVKLLSLRGAAGNFTAETSAGLIRSQFVILALGRRGTPRKLGVQGEESKKVLFQLIDTASYTGKKVLVVGGGDSAIEAATGLANQPGNEVALSYRKRDFYRLKTRNEERIHEYIKSKRVKVLFSSELVRIGADSVTMKITPPEREEHQSAAGREVTIPNDFVFIFAGGEPPFPLLKQIGIGFGSDLAVNRQSEQLVAI